MIRGSLSSLVERCLTSMFSWQGSYHEAPLQVWQTPQPDLVPQGCALSGRETSSRWRVRRTQQEQHTFSCAEAHQPPSSLQIELLGGRVFLHQLSTRCSRLVLPFYPRSRLWAGVFQRVQCTCRSRCSRAGRGSISFGDKWFDCSWGTSSPRRGRTCKKLGGSSADINVKRKPGPPRSWGLAPTPDRTSF